MAKDPVCGVERFLLGFTSSYRILAFGLTQSQLIALASLALAVPLLAQFTLRRERVSSIERAFR